MADAAVHHVDEHVRVGERPPLEFDWLEVARGVVTSHAQRVDGRLHGGRFVHVVRECVEEEGWVVERLLLLLLLLLLLWIVEELELLRLHYT